MGGVVLMNKYTLKSNNFGVDFYAKASRSINRLKYQAPESIPFHFNPQKIWTLPTNSYFSFLRNIPKVLFTPKSFGALHELRQEDALSKHKFLLCCTTTTTSLVFVDFAWISYSNSDNPFCLWCLVFGFSLLSLFLGLITNITLNM